MRKKKKQQRRKNRKQKKQRQQKQRVQNQANNLSIESGMRRNVLAYRAYEKAERSTLVRNEKSARNKRFTAQDLFKNGDCEGSLSLLKSAAEDIKGSPYSVAASTVYHDLAVAFSMRQRGSPFLNLCESIKFHDLALKCPERKSDPTRYVQSLVELGSELRRLAYFNQGQEEYARIVAQAKEQFRVAREVRTLRYPVMPYWHFAVDVNESNFLLLIARTEEELQEVLAILDSALADKLWNPRYLELDPNHPFRDIKRLKHRLELNREIAKFKISPLSVSETTVSWLRKRLNGSSLRLEDRWITIVALVRATNALSPPQPNRVLEFARGLLSDFDPSDLPTDQFLDYIELTKSLGVEREVLTGLKTRIDNLIQKRRLVRAQSDADHLAHQAQSLAFVAAVEYAKEGRHLSAFSEIGRVTGLDLEAFYQRRLWQPKSEREVSLTKIRDDARQISAMLADLEVTVSNASATPEAYQLLKDCLPKQIMYEDVSKELELALDTENPQGYLRSASQHYAQQAIDAFYELMACSDRYRELFERSIQPMTLAETETLIKAHPDRMFLRVEAYGTKALAIGVTCDRGEIVACSTRLDSSAIASIVRASREGCAAPDEAVQRLNLKSAIL